LSTRPKATGVGIAEFLESLKGKKYSLVVQLDRKQIDDSIFKQSGFHFLTFASGFLGQRPDSIEEIHQLDLFATSVSDQSIPNLLKCKKLKQLDIQFTKITPNGVTLLKAGLPACEIVR
jgi:hypothetical protein